MKILVLSIICLSSFDLFGQREHVSSEKIRFTIKDSEYLDSNDGAIIPNITTGFRPFEFNWFWPNGSVTNDTVLIKAISGKYVLHFEDAQCGTFEDTIEVRSVLNAYKNSEKFELLGIAPNPFNDVLDIELEVGKEQEVRITLYNHFGGQIFERSQRISEGIQKINLHLQEIPAGMYIIQISNSSSRTLVNKIVKQ